MTVHWYSTTQRYSLLNSGVFARIYFPGVFFPLVKRQSSLRTLRGCSCDMKRNSVKGDAMTQVIQLELLKGEKSLFKFSEPENSHYIVLCYSCLVYWVSRYMFQVFSHCKCVTEQHWLLVIEQDSMWKNISFELWVNSSVYPRKQIVWFLRK